MFLNSSDMSMLLDRKKGNKYKRSNTSMKQIISHIIAKEN